MRSVSLGSSRGRSGVSIGFGARMPAPERRARSPTARTPREEPDLGTAHTRAPAALPQPLEVDVPLCRIRPHEPHADALADVHALLAAHHAAFGRR